MCNYFRSRIPYQAYVEEFSHFRLPLFFPKPDAAPNLEPRGEIWPTELAPVIRPAEGGVELVRLPWGLSPARPKGRAVINLRSEGRTLTRGRCLVPGSHYFEFTGAKSPKTRWRFTRTGEDWFCFPGVIGRGDGPDGSSVEASRCSPPRRAGCRAVSQGQPVILDRAYWAAWLTATEPPPGLLAPSPPGCLQVRESPRESSQCASIPA
jgi:putative SOS response-associated peptidase YedK